MGERSAIHRFLMKRLGARPNSVQHKLVVGIADCPYSSSHRSVAMGFYLAHGAGGDVALNEPREALKDERCKARIDTLRFAYPSYAC